MMHYGLEDGFPPVALHPNKILSEHRAGLVGVVHDLYPPFGKPKHPPDQSRQLFVRRFHH